jgi:RimJ/RimL family protein N-acetyltransferase
MQVKMFIILLKHVIDSSFDEIAAMIGDVSLIVNSSGSSSSAEVSVMIAETSYRRKGFAAEAVKAIIQYGMAYLMQQSQATSPSLKQRFPI